VTIRGDRDGEREPEFGDDDDDLSWPLLDRYLTGTASAADERELAQWALEHAAAGPVLASLRTFVREADGPTLAADADELWAALATRLTWRRRLWRSRTIAQIGAIAATLVIAALLVDQSNHRRPAAVALQNPVFMRPPSIVSRDTEVAGDTGRPRIARGDGRASHPATDSITIEPSALALEPDDAVPLGLRDGRGDATEYSVADDRPGGADTRWP
jgi:hypothetical protein